MAAAAVKIADRYGDDALIFPKGGALLVDIDRIWPDCNADPICEGAGEYRTVAIVGTFKGDITWLDPMTHGHKENCND